MSQINPMPFADAQKLGIQVYELILTNWGNRGSLQDANNGSIAYPTVKSNANGSIPIVPANDQFLLPPIPSLAAIAISPRSHVDRCILNYTSLQNIASNRTTSIPVTSGASTGPLNVPIDQGFVNNGGILGTEQILTVGAPFLGQQMGNILVRAVTDHWYSDSYTPTLPLPTAPFQFGTGIAAPNDGTPNNGGPRFINPELRLLLYFTIKGALPPTTRAPLSQSFSFTIAGAGTRELIKIVPMMGRRHLSVNIQNGAVAGTTVTVSGTFHQLAQTNTPPFAPVQANTEIILSTSAVLAAGVSAQLNIDNPRGLSFMMIFLQNAALATAECSFTVSD